jgi:hypothetical protein
VLVYLRRLLSSIDNQLLHGDNSTDRQPTTMKFSLSLITLLLSSLVASEGLSFSFGGQKPLGDGEAVPGDNPLTYCKAEHGDDILVLDHVNLTPNPPQAYVYSFRIGFITTPTNLPPVERHLPLRLRERC